MRTATIQEEIVIGTFIGWTFRVNPEEANQRDINFDSAVDADAFIAENRDNDTPVIYFSRFQGPDGIELGGGYGKGNIVGSPAYRVNCGGCKKHLWSHGKREPNVNYGSSFCEDCSEDRDSGNDSNRYDGSMHMEREY